MTASAETVLPEPLSPTRPNVFPRCTEKVASSMTGSHSWPGQELDPQSPPPRAAQLAGSGVVAVSAVLADVPDWPRRLRSRASGPPPHETAAGRSLPPQRVA